MCHMMLNLNLQGAKKKNGLTEVTAVKLRIQHKFRCSHASFIVVLNVFEQELFALERNFECN